MTDKKPYNNIILIGMPGSGKTTLGKLIAGELDYRFVDTDQLIYTETGKTPRRLVEEQGREIFLSVQDQVVFSINQWDSVISTGGGIVHSSAAMQHLKSLGTVIYLNTSYHIIEQRMDPDRKLVRAKGSLLDLYNERVTLYNKYADKILECDNKEPELLCNRLLEFIMGNK